MKRLLLIVIAVTALMGAQGQNKSLALIGKESKYVETDMLMNAHYLGAHEGLDLWLTRSDEGVKGLANKRDWHVVKLSDDLFPMERVDLPKSHRYQVLGIIGTQRNQGVSVLLVDSSATDHTTILRARITTNPLRLVGGRLDTMDHFVFGCNDLSKVWCSVSPNGKYIGVLTIVQFVEDEEYIAVERIFDENLNEVWAKDFAVGATTTIFVDDNGTMYTMGQKRTSDGMSFPTNILSRNTDRSYNIEVQSDPIHDLQIVNVVDSKILCWGLFTESAYKPEEGVTNGVMTMVLDADNSLNIKSLKMRFFENEDKNIMMNVHTKEIQREQELIMVAPLGSLRMPYGAVVAVGHRHKLRYVNSNSTVEKTWFANGIHLVAFDTQGNLRWVRNIRRCDQTDIADAMLKLHLFADGDNFCLLRNENYKEPEAYYISTEAYEYEVGDKSNLVMYTISPSGNVKKSIVERETKHALANIGRRADGSLALLSLHGNKCRMAVMK